MGNERFGDEGGFVAEVCFEDSKWEGEAFTSVTRQIDVGYQV